MSTQSERKAVKYFERLVEFLRETQWSSRDRDGCAECHVCEWGTERHSPDCALGNLLAEIEADRS